MGATRDVTPVAYRTYRIGSLRKDQLGVFPEMYGSTPSALFYDRLEKDIKLALGACDGSRRCRRCSSEKPSRVVLECEDDCHDRQPVLGDVG
jgi:hypothetical protein